MKNRGKAYLTIGLFILFLLLNIILNYNVWGETSSNNKVVIKVNDPVFYETLVKSYGGVQTGNELEFTMTEEQINNLKEFEYTGSDSKKIKDITGIKNFTQLETIKLNKNAISDITEISQLTKLKNIEITENNLKKLPDLSTLTNLSTLNIYNNSISDLSGIKNNNSLIELNASSNQIVNITPVTNNLIKLQKLNLSTNNISDISTIYRLSELTDLDLSGNTSIREIKQITELQNLTKLNLANNDNITDLTKVLDKKSDNKTPKLINLQELNLEKVNNTNSKISVLTLGKLINLKILNLNSNGLTTMSGIIEFDNLEKLYLNKNQIEDISPLVKIKTQTINGETIKTVEKVSKVKDLRMAENKIEKIDVLSYLYDSITYLDLRKNHIHHIDSIETLYKLNPENLYLQNQTANFNIKRKSNTNVKQKIILESIIQRCKNPSSKIYSSDAIFTVTGDAVLNTDTYTLPNGSTGKYSEEPGNYNIVFAEEVKEGNVGTVTINGGRADGSVYTYTITGSKGSKGSKVYDSICFEDYYLNERVTADLLKQKRKVVGSIPYIMNIEFPEIAKVTELTLTGDEGKRVKSIKGLESFINLKILDLSTNDISSDDSISRIDLLKDLPNIEQLNLSDNKLETADVITKFKLIKRLSLANNNIISLQPFEEWLQNLKDNKSTSKLVEINVSGNNIEDLTPLKDITTLDNLNVSKNKIEDINPIKNMALLTILNLSNNKIEDISVIGELNRLSTLYLSTNKVKDISSLRNLSLSNLDISNNKIENLDDIKNMSSLIELKLNTNKIRTIEPIKNFVIKDFEMNYQKLYYALTQTNDDIVNVDLAKLFKEAKQEGSIIYTDNDFECTNCKITEDGKVQINLNELGNKIATVKIKGGNATGSQLTIAKPLNPIIEYNIKEKTNQDVVATVKFDGRQANIINNDENNKYTFTKNGEFTFEYEDEYGFAGKITATVNWIDKEPPKATVALDNSNITNQDVTVTITADEECKQIEGWTLSADKKTLTKKYSNNVNEKVTVEDTLGNKTVVDVIISNIDKTAPIVTGVENNKKYNIAVIPKIIDENLETVELKKGENIVTGFKSGNSITENGEYTLTAKDKAGNITIVTFTISLNPQVKSLIGIEIISQPSKKIYKEGEKFDRTGMKVQAVYSDGSKVEVTDYTVIGEEDSLQIGTTSVRITYTENGSEPQYANQEITVTARVLERLRINIDDKYTQEQDENIVYIREISPQTTLEDLKNNIDTNGIIKVKNGTAEKVDNNTKIGTGMTLEISLEEEKKEYVLIVNGDTTGDGIVGFEDILQINKHRLGKGVLTKAKEKAADVNKDKSVDITDIFKINKYRLGRGTL